MTMLVATPESIRIKGSGRLSRLGDDPGLKGYFLKTLWTAPSETREDLTILAFTTINMMMGL
jgi:hypothetical protein